jgi:hypothetical protein
VLPRRDRPPTRTASRTSRRRRVEIAARTPFFGAVDYTFDTGVVPEITLGDLLWHDVNGDGVFDAATETPLAGIVVVLRSINGTEIARTTTDAAGNYRFAEDLTSFTQYQLTVALAQLPGFEATPGAPPQFSAATGDVVLRKLTAEYGSPT